MKKLFDNFNGKDIYTYTIKSDSLEVDVVEYGARINAIRFNGYDVALGYKSVKGSQESACYIGATVGRCANRIKDAKFIINGLEYNVSKNEKENHLHGGFEGFDQKIFNVERAADNKLVMSYFSKDLEEGYPGNFKLTVTFTVEQSSLLIEYKGISDKDTIFNPTSHVYFNFNGEQSLDCLDNELYINADKYSIVDSGLIPTGELKDVLNTPFDFRKIKAIKKDFDSPLLKSTRGYDHNFILNGEKAATVKNVKTGIIMDLYTDLPCMQLYTSGFLKAEEGKTHPYDQFGGFCLEPQYMPNAINMDIDKTPFIKANEEVYHYIKYDFTAINK